jgi:hypothetical protein
MSIENVLAFARTHDWGRHAFINNQNRVVVCGTYAHPIGNKVFVAHERCTFGDMRSLRDWAGY